MTLMSTISKAAAAELDRRVLAYLRKRGEKGALRSEVFDDLATRGTVKNLDVSLQRLERAGLVRLGAREGNEGMRRFAVPEEAPATTSGKAAA